MNKILSALALCALLGACAAPTEPYRVTAVASEKVSDAKFAKDDAACKAKTRAVTDQEAANGQLDVQNDFDRLYADCMLDKGYAVEELRRRMAYYGPYYGPGPWGPYWGPGPYWGTGFYYGAGWGYGRW
ncbi:hypothetical protein M2323_003936 [Rhodoblastus acidophilus]|uniref:hypothetical protein n=1 Tax=Rhodoblastus acidophilus TaxID=1074 RepID=UPI0022241C7A|nr:hypothetical protein [Rhodoblastus acidophilus]MCW2286099.1 hypothetical protein [Rhodoblastus acidophilus]MCW2334993.1 hypothetical protein [Rhodoblastus acidophilus]